MKTVDEIRAMLRAACEAAGSQIAWAKANGLSGAYVSDVLQGRRDPGESIAQAFGYQPVTMYVERAQRAAGKRR